jgi:hypothetical protein
MLSQEALAPAELAAAREARLVRLEEAVAKLQPKRKDAWEKLQSVGTLASGVLVAVVGYFLTGSVNNALQRQQLQLSNVKEMRDLIGQLNTADADQADAAALTLSAFGRPAVPAVMGALVAGGEVRAPAAERALRAIGLDDPEAVCDPARKVIDNRTARFSWLAHLAALRLLGDLDCGGARESVEAYARALAGVRSADDLATFAARVDGEVPLDREGADQLGAQASRTLGALRRREGSGLRR